MIPPKATQSPNTMSVWTLSRCLCHFFMGFPLVVLDIVAKYPIVGSRRSELKILLLFAMVKWFLLRNFQHPKILCRFSHSDCDLFFYGAGVDDGGTGLIFVSLL